MVEHKVDTLKKLLARRVICEIIFSYHEKKIGSKATRSTIRSDFLVKADEISKAYNIKIESHFQDVIESLPVDRKKGIYLPCKNMPTQKAEEIVTELKAVIGTRPAKFDKIMQILTEAKLGLDIVEWMSGSDEYLKKRGESVESVLSDLRNFRESSYSPAAFEYLMVKAFCIMFQLPIYASYGIDFNADTEPSVVWRGKISSGNVPELFAPGGASDSIVYFRGRGYLLGEATLRSTRTQWETEIEPIFTHAGEIDKEHNLGTSLFICLVSPKLLEQTYERLKTLTNFLNVFYLDIDDLYKISLISSWIPGLPHHEVSKLFGGLHSVLDSSISFTMYQKSHKNHIKLWCSEMARDFARTFMSIKIYEKLGSERLMRCIKVAEELEEDESVKNYLSIMGVPYNEIKKAIVTSLRDYIAYASLLGLVMEVNGYLQRLPIDEFVNSLYKLLGLIRKK